MRPNHTRPAPRPDLVERWLARCITSEAGCWIYGGSKDTKGYAHVRYQIDGRGFDARLHRIAYEHLKAPIPEGLDIDHLCRVPACVNPEHMEPVTRQENTRRGNAGRQPGIKKTHCLNGHAYDDVNSYWRPDGLGRNCRACGREKKRERERLARLLEGSA